jgi:acetyl-CoA carboxylase carboxyltransferase component
LVTKKLEAISDQKEKEILYNKLVDKMYEAGQAMEAASFLEIDAVIDPSKTRETIIKAQHSPK